jgi:hypothetical protein
VLLGDQTSTQRAALDTALSATYAAVGITEDPTTWTRPAPTLRTLRDLLAGAPTPGTSPDSEGAVEAGLAARLHPFVDGAFNGLFDGPTSTAPGGHLTVFCLRELPDEVKPVATLLTLDAIWATVSDPTLRRPRLVVVDEAWLLMRQPAGAAFLARLAKSARKYWAGLTVATQDTADLLGSDLGRAVVTNAATQILLRQAPQAIDEITTVFHLSAGERQFLLSADRGHGLLVAGAIHRVAFQIIASAAEDELVTSSPAQLAAHAATDDAAGSFGHVDTGDADLGFGGDRPDGDRAAADFGTLDDADDGADDGADEGTGEGWVVNDPGWGPRGGSW